jgi:hypothetical protein
MPHDVFISYSSLDKTAADAACAALEAAGLRCWIAPRDVTPGAEWGEAIIVAINQCRVMILVFSANANNSPQIRREVERAVSKGVPIIPLRIQDIAPARSLEYFIGDVHWLDALTPPLEAHLRRLAESVRALLQVDAMPRQSRAPSPNVAPPSATPQKTRVAMLSIVGCAIAFATGIGVWWYIRGHVLSPASHSIPAATSAAVDPSLIGAFELDTVRDDYNWRFIFTIAASGTYDLVTTQQESGTFQASGNTYRTVANKTGRVRQGTYSAVGTSAIAVTSATGTAVFQPTQLTTPLDPANPVMLGIWTSTVTQGGVTWALTIQNNPDGTYSYLARAEDNGMCTFANQQWRTMSAVTGQTNAGTYQVINAHSVELTGPQGPALWQRK